jgi:hypothetical protein
VIAVSSLPRELASGLYPEEGRLVRGLLLQSGWVIERVEQSDACIVTYVAQVRFAFNDIMLRDAFVTNDTKVGVVSFSPASILTVSTCDTAGRSCGLVTEMVGKYFEFQTGPSHR